MVPAHSRMWSVLVAASFAACVSAVVPKCYAQEAPADVRDARLPVLTPTERTALEPLLAQGPVAYVEFTHGEELPAVVLAIRVHAPAAVVARLVAEPEGYPQFMPALDAVHVTSRDHGAIAYDWTWRAAILELRGTNELIEYPPPRGRESHGYRVSIRAVSGDLGTGRFLWRIVPTAQSESLVMLSVRLDTRQGSYLARQLAAGARSINRSVNMSLAFVMMLGARRAAETRTGFRGQSAAAPDGNVDDALVRPDVDLEALTPLLTRGDILALRTRGDVLDQVTVIGRMGKPESDVRTAMLDPIAFGTALMPGCAVHDAGRDEIGKLFDWNVSLPLIGSAGRMRLAEEGARIRLDALHGNLVPGHFRFETHAVGEGDTVVVGWGHFDPASAAWLLRTVVEGAPDFGHGIEASSMLMVVRAVRTRLWPN